MEFKKDDYILAYWFAADKDGNDWMITVIKRDNEWIAEYRFRYRKDEKIFGSKDEKNYYSFKIPASEPENLVIEKINKIFEIIKLRYSECATFTEVKGDIDKFIYLLAQEKFSNIKIMKISNLTPEEKKRYGIKE